MSLRKFILFGLSFGLFFQNGPVGAQSESLTTILHPPEKEEPAALETLSSTQVIEKSPVEIVRSINALQDQIAVGKKPVEAAMPKIMNQMAERLLAENPDVWRDPKNIHAVIAYLLSGGQPRVAKKILGSETLPQEEKNLLNAAYSYVTGHKAKAESLLDSVNPQILPPLLGAHVALIKALLVADKDRSRAVHYLDMARILAPGTLIEEAALRREVFLTDNLNKLSKFIFLSRQYIRRFHNSIYFDNFYKHFLAAIIRLGLADNPEQILKLNEIIVELKSPERTEIYLAITYNSLIQGHIQVASLALVQARNLEKEVGIEPDRMRLYQASIDFLAGKAEKGLDTISHLDEAKLSISDIGLMHAISAIGGKLRSLEMPTSEPESEQIQFHTSLPDYDHVSELTDLANKSISATEMLLRGSSL